MHWTRNYRKREPLKEIWVSMKQRCYNKNNPNYFRYGARGIKVCDRWLESFDNFKRDMGLRPAGRYSIERIDNDGNYKPSNCKWATQHEQILNTRVRRDNSSGYKGVAPSQNKANPWRAYIWEGGKQLNVGVYKTALDAHRARTARLGIVRGS
jgi:hypothetical protein